MKKTKFILIVITLLLACILSACGESSGKTSGASADSGTRTYHGEDGDVQVPAKPKRVAVLAHIYVGNVLKLGITPVAVNEWVKGNKFFGDKLENTEVVAEGSIEKLIELEPDLIIAFSSDKNLKKYSEIAPTVALTNTEYDYLQQHIEIGKIVGKENEAEKWVEEWTEKAKEEKEKVRAAIGEDVTVTVLETMGKETYIYGKNWGRGTEIIYQALGIQAPDKVEKDVFGPGYKSISTELIPEYAGDIMFVGTGDETGKGSFMDTSVWKEIPAVQNNKVIEFDSESFWFNDAISLENQLEFIVNELTKAK
ncbi:iron-hydroxamate ABC transporter substrate-binding protein [Cytobacillus oceanisediminis]|uniref:iron-hydroxamate ABC transporter substrate-binding protein n=1 Tax=Cytobacillus oceanisediminis TaxID=665099 RepID=UPI001C23CCF5|nr:iron-hydroxamate ABC transporter substrate-binding protein [Cytobacillus oceanisediminis]MBU8772963.1 iron-hydroxamate ABC transporter substrate-binding protein [Cytobacillus oceanisediminis]